MTDLLQNPLDIDMSIPKTIDNNRRVRRGDRKERDHSDM